MINAPTIFEVNKISAHDVVGNVLESGTADNRIHIPFCTQRNVTLKISSGAQSCEGGSSVDFLIWGISSV
jgi:hypothetical protein